MLYHVTKPSYVRSIRRRGILPKTIIKKKGLTCWSGPHPFVWVTDNPEYILCTQAGPRWGGVVLELDLVLDDVVPAIHRNHISHSASVWCESKHEFIIDHVPPDLIKGTYSPF